MLTAMLDQETGARGYLNTRDVRFLQPWYQGVTNFASAFASSRSLAGEDAVLQRSLTSQANDGAVWHSATGTAISLFRATGQHPTTGEELDRKGLMDAFRAANAAYATLVSQRRDYALSLATWVAVALAAGLSIALVSLGLLLARGMARREKERQESQRELRDLLQVSESETESRMLLIRHIERAVPGCRAAVLNCNNSDDRLEAVLGSRVDQTPLRDLETEQLQPRSCMWRCG